MANNNSNKKSTKRINQTSLVRQSDAQLAQMLVRSLSSPINSNVGVNRKRNGNMNRKQSSVPRMKNPSSVAAAYSTGVSTSRPRVTSGPSSINIKHREFIGNISGAATAAFTSAFALALNPGIAATFPWLSIMAQNWESYRFKKLCFYYLTRTGSNVPGSVILCPDYDAADAAPLSEQILDTYADVREDAPWKNIDCSLNVASMFSMGPKKFLRFGALSANQDIKTYDVGNMFIYTVDSSAAASWGKLWVEYDVDMFTPQLPPGGSSFSQIAGIDGGTAQTAAKPFGTSPIVTGNMQVVAGDNGTNSTLVISNALIGAEYFLAIQAVGTVITGAVAVSAITGGTAKTNTGGFPAAALTSFSFYTFTATASTVTLVVSSTATTITDCNAVLALLPTSVF